MKPHTRAIIAASVFAIGKGEKVVGVYDHAARKHLKIAAEHRDGRLQAFDGDRSAYFGGDLPDLYDHGDKAFVTINSTGMTAQGYDRGSNGFFTARIGDGLVELYDHAENAWFAYNV